MNKQTRMAFFILLIIVLLLAASTSFFAAKSVKLGRGAKSSPAATSNKDQTTPTAAVSSAVTKAASSSEKPSKPAETYAIQKGETLMSVATKNGLTTQDIILANGIEDPDKIQAGQNLIIPKGGQVDFTIDNARATSLQDYVTNGRYEFRKDPVETSRSDAPNVYGLTIGDNYTLKNSADGKATVQVSREGNKYLIELTQPSEKGEGGIWAITAIKPM